MSLISSSAAVRISAIPALSSAPRSVVPSVVISVLPLYVFNLGKSLTEILHRGKKSTQKVRYELILDVHRKIYMAVKNQKEEEAAKWMTTHLINAESDILAK